MREDLTYIAVVLDRSASMRSCLNETIQGFNNFIDEQKAEPGEALFSLVLFDHEYTPVVQGISLRSATHLTPETYVPRGDTALREAYWPHHRRRGRKAARDARGSAPGQGADHDPDGWC